jgi:DNA polymerase-3 subunit delta'
MEPGPAEPAEASGGFDRIRGQAAAVGMLRRLLAGTRIPHALLFSGIDGIGKYTTAKVVAMAVHCEKPAPPADSSVGESAGTDACGRCRSCRRIASGGHPDVLTIEPVGPMIRIGQVRELLRVFSLKPHGGGCRVAIFRDAQTLNTEAANALLKLLEEPPPRSLLILTADRVSDLLPTIVSRCQPIRFQPLSPTTVAGLVAERKGLSPDDAGILGTLGRGSLARAEALYEDGWMRRRDWLIEVLEGMDRMRLRDRLALAEALSGQRRTLETAIDIASGWFRDLGVALAAPEAVENRDLTDRIERAAQRLGAEGIEAALRSLLASARSLEGNTNPRLVADALVLGLARLHGAT